MKSCVLIVILVITMSVHLEAKVAGRQRVLRNVATGLCLSLSDEDESLKSVICSRINEQRWVITQDTKLISVASEECVTSSDDGTVTTSECTRDSNQKWTFKNGQVKNEATGKCLDTDSNYNVVGAACLNADYQKWYISFADTK